MSNCIYYYSLLLVHNGLYLTAYDVLALFIFEPHICFTSKLNPIFTSLLCLRKRCGAFPIPAPKPIEALVAGTLNLGRAGCP